MTVRSRVLQDHRENSRIIALLDCKLTYSDRAYDAVMVDLSRNGALISAAFMPSIGEQITLSVKSDHLKSELTLTGKVLRGARVTTDHGKKCRFVVRFDQTPLDLIRLIGKLHAA